MYIWSIWSENKLYNTINLIYRWSEYERSGQSGRTRRQRQLASVLTVRVQRVRSVDRRRTRAYHDGPSQGFGFRIVRHRFLLFDIG